LDLLDRVDYRLAETQAEKQAIYQLRYRAYLKEGAIEPNRHRIVTDNFDELDNNWNFGVYLDGALVSSLRITVASPDQPISPSMNVFRDLLEPELARGRVIVDPTRFVADPERSRQLQELPYITLRLAYVACAYFNADIGLATVRTEHQAFYRRTFMHQPISAARNYPGLIKPIVLMAVDYPAMREKVFTRYPFLRSSYFERRMLFERIADRLSPTLAMTDFAVDGDSLLPAGHSACGLGEP
jgi:N-acyl-L-homoserine lactone synthetase